MGDFMPIIYINYNLYYYGGFRAPNCLMTFVTHDTRDLPGFIRRPQYQCCNFALAFEMQRRLRAAAQRRPSELASAFSDLKVQSVASQSPCTAVVIVNQKYS